MNLIKRIQSDLQSVMSSEIAYRNDPEKFNLHSSFVIGDLIQIKEGCRAIISRLPDINCKKENVTDEKLIPLIKKIIQEEKVRQVYQLKILTAEDVKGRTGKEVDSLVKEIISDTLISLETPKIKYMSTLIPELISQEELCNFLNTIDFKELKNPMMSIGLAKKEFGADRIDGGLLKKIITENYIK